MICLPPDIDSLRRVQRRSKHTGFWAAAGGAAESSPTNTAAATAARTALIIISAFWLQSKGLPDVAGALLGLRVVAGGRLLGKEKCDFCCLRI